VAKQSKSGNKSKSSSPGGSGKLIGRIVVYSLLAILIVVGLLDYRVKSQAAATGKAWREVQGSLKQDEEFLQSQLKQYIQGAPTTEERDANMMDGNAIDHITTYRWSGLLRNYDIYIGFGLGNDPAVEAIRGPGDKDPLAEE
jgi:hypothetical protein